MITEPQQLDLTRLKPLPGFAPTDESKLANVGLKLAEGRTLTVDNCPRSFAILGRTRSAVAQLDRLPKKKGAIHCILNGEYALFDFIPAILELSKTCIDELHCATLSFSKKNVDALQTLTADGMIGSVVILCSHYFSAQDRDIYNHMQTQLKGARFRLVAMRTHAKVLLLRLGDIKLAIESSANLRSSHNVEQATVIRHDGVYGFHRRWIEDLVAKGGK